MASRSSAAIPRGPKPPFAKRRGDRPVAYRLGWLLGKAVLWFIVGSVIWVLAYAVINPPVTATMLINRDGIRQSWRPIERIDPVMAQAVIAGEDARFCTHRGFDADAIAAAFVRNLSGGRIRGGSTISQQTAKNAFLWQGGGYFRKGLEAWFTLLIETIWGKRRIMEVYLNIAETGIGTYGVEAGAKRYFRKSAANLSRAEAARIAAVLPLPQRRAAVAPRGFTRRYGNAILARSRLIAREGGDACLRD